jgi:hypothetical protein
MFVVLVLNKMNAANQQTLSALFCSGDGDGVIVTDIQQWELQLTSFTDISMLQVEDDFIHGALCSPDGGIYIIKMSFHVWADTGKFRHPPQCKVDHLEVDAKIRPVGVDMVKRNLFAITCDSEGDLIGLSTVTVGVTGVGLVTRVAGMTERRRRGTNGDGRQEVARFRRPTRVASVRDSATNAQCFMVVDCDRVRLTSGTKALTAFLSVLGDYTRAWGMKTSASAQSSEAAKATQALGSFMQDVHVESCVASSSPADTTTTNGPDRCFSSATRTSMLLLARQLRQLAGALKGHYPIDRVKVRCLVTDTNEHFHARVRAAVSGGMPSLCKFMAIFYRVVMEMAKRLSTTGFLIYTGRSYYQPPSPTAMPWSKLAAVLCAAAAKVKKHKKKLPRGHRQLVKWAYSLARGAKQSTPRARTTMFKAGSLPAPSWSGSRHSAADERNAELSQFGSTETEEQQDHIESGIMVLRAGTMVAMLVKNLKMPPAMIVECARCGPAAVLRLESPVTLHAGAARTTIAELWIPTRKGGRTLRGSGIVMEIECEHFAATLEAGEDVWRATEDGYDLVLTDAVWATFLGDDDIGDDEVEDMDEVESEEEAPADGESNDEAEEPEARPRRFPRAVRRPFSNWRKFYV